MREVSGKDLEDYSNFPQLGHTPGRSLLVVAKTGVTRAEDANLRRHHLRVPPARSEVITRRPWMALTALVSFALAVITTDGLAAMVTDRLATTVADRVFRHGPYEHIRDRLWRVKLGTPMESVSRNLLFDPVRVEEGTDHVVWYYDRSPVAAVVPAIVFDKQTARVVALHVDDRRRRLGPCSVGRPPDTPSE